MAESYKEKCPTCGNIFLVQELPMGVPGGKEREEYYCPYCHKEVGYIITDGFVRTSKIDENE